MRLSLPALAPPLIRNAGSPSELQLLRQGEGGARFPRLDSLHADVDGNTVALA
jgi:hypothetical protein